MKISKILASLSLVLAITSCQTEDVEIQEAPETNIQQQDIPAADIVKIKALGFSTDDLAISADGLHYIIEGDMKVGVSWLSEMDADNIAAKQQGSIFGLVDCWKLSDIKIRHSPTFPPYFRTALAEAVSQWNNTTGTNINIRYVDDEQDIYVTESNDLRASTNGSAFLAGTGDIPGRPGEVIEINNNSDRAWTDWVDTMMHEIGHTLGFFHTNQGDDPRAVNIEGTGLDRNSIMWSSPVNPDQFRLSEGDKNAFRILYGNCN